MSDKEVRMFNIQRSRKGHIVSAVLCNGKSHFVCEEGLRLHHPDYYKKPPCDGKACRGVGSEPLNISLLNIESQELLGLCTRIPSRIVLVTEPSRLSWPSTKYGEYVYSGGEVVTPKQFEIGTLLAEDAGTAFIKNGCIYYVRNVAGKARVSKGGKEGRKRTEKKLAKLRRGERLSEMTYEVVYLKEQLNELMQLSRTSEVRREIENVKELLRLAASLSVEASIEASEGNEQIEGELANLRAREISAELQQTRKRLLLEKRVRDEVRQELKERFDN